MLPCGVVYDLLPMHIEKLTSEETTKLIEEHLESCENCRKLKANMETELPIRRAAKPKLEFLKKLRRSSLIGVVLTIVAAFLCMAPLYNQEFIDVANTASIENVINERLSGFEDIEVNMLESKKVGNRLFVLFEQLNNESDIISGVAHFRRGLFGGYCLRTVSHSDWPLYTWNVISAGFKDYLVVYGINEPADAEHFKIFPKDLLPANHSDPPRDYSGIEPLYTGAVETPLFSVTPITGEQAKSLNNPEFVHYFDAEGSELDRYEMAEEYGYDGRSGGGTAYSDQSTLYVFCAIIFLLAIIIIRYFIIAQREYSHPL